MRCGRDMGGILMHVRTGPYLALRIAGGVRMPMLGK